MQQAANAERKLYNQCKQLGISDSGFKWMDVALDPFKDITVKPDGYPDRLMAPSVIQTVHGSFDVAAPASSAGGNWDCNIFSDQITVPVALKISPSLSGYVIAQNTQSGTKHERGGIVIRAAAAGVPLDITTTVDNLPIDPTLYVDCKGRIIAIGLEVHNTTSELNKQGSVITYRVPDLATDEIVTTILDSTGTATCTSTTQKALLLAEPPITTSEAIDLPGSLSWEAEKGAYVVPVFSEEDNIPTDLGILGVLTLDEDNGNYYPPVLAIGNIATLAPDLGTAKMPTTISGSYFSGLSPTTTLSVKYVYYFEQFPSIESTLKRVADHSCPEDFVAIESYTKIAKSLPTGVPVNQNFLGAFIAGVSRLASWVLPKIPTIIRGVEAVTAGVSAATTIMNNSQKKEEKVIEVVESRANKRNSQQVVVLPTTTRQIQARTQPKIIEEVIRVVEPAPKKNRSQRTIQRSNRRAGGASTFDNALAHANAGSRWIGSR